MPEEAESHTIRLLQEMRQEIRHLSATVGDLAERFDTLNQHVEGNTLTFNLVAGVAYDHERRIAALEQGRP